MQDESGRLIAADLCILGEMLHIVNVYAPVGGLNARNDEQNRFYDSIYICMNEVFFQRLWRETLIVSTIPV